MGSLAEEKRESLDSLAFRILDKKFESISNQSTSFQKQIILRFSEEKCLDDPIQLHDSSKVIWSSERATIST